MLFRSVIFTWKHALEATSTIANGNWMWITEMKALDDYTLECKTEAPYRNLLFNVGINVSNILCEKAMTADPEKGLLIGTGAYKLKEFEPNDYLLFERNEDYWGPAPASKYQRWTRVTEAAARTIMLQTGELASAGVGTTDLPLFENDPNYRIHRYAANNSQGIVFNTQDALCGDLNFRLAVRYALDIRTLAKFASPTYDVPVLDGTIWGLNVPYKNESIPFIEQDLAKAKEYLANSKYQAGQTVEITASSASDMGMAVIEQLAAIGVKAEINVLDSATMAVYTNPSDNKSQMSLFFARVSQNPVDSLRLNFMKGMSNNRASYDNPEADKLMTDVITMTDEDEIRETYYKIQEMITADCPYIPVYWMPSTAVRHLGVGGFMTSPSAMEDRRYAYQVIDGLEVWKDRVAKG